MSVVGEGRRKAVEGAPAARMVDADFHIITVAWLKEIYFIEIQLFARILSTGKQFLGNYPEAIKFEFNYQRKYFLDAQTTNQWEKGSICKLRAKP